MSNFYQMLLFLIIIATKSFASPMEIGDCDTFLCNVQYQKFLLKKVSEKMPDLATYPSYHYPNDNHLEVVKKFPEGKILVFGYGSLMNKESALRTVKPEAFDSKEKVIAFGVKRLFNYKAVKTSHWGAKQDKKEKAMLNLTQTLNISSIANGVVIQVDAEDFSRLVQRETGYDLIPVLVASWDEVLNENPNVNIQVAYTFSAAHELRNHINYTSTQYYPVRGYMHAIQETTQLFGGDFAKMWNSTTYLADGTTSVDEWDEKTFDGILSTYEP